MARRTHLTEIASIAGADLSLLGAGEREGWLDSPSLLAALHPSFLALAHTARSLLLLLPLPPSSAPLTVRPSLSPDDGHITALDWLAFPDAGLLALAVATSAGSLLVYSPSGELVHKQVVYPARVLRLRFREAGGGDMRGSASTELCVVMPGVIARFDGSHLQGLLQRWSQEVASRMWDSYSDMAAVDEDSFARITFQLWSVNKYGPCTDAAIAGLMPPPLLELQSSQSYYCAVTIGEDAVVSAYRVSEDKSRSLVGAILSKVVPAAFSTISSFSKMIWRSEKSSPKKTRGPSQSFAKASPVTCLKDPPRKGENLTLSPSGTLAAVTDSLGRILLLDTQALVVVRLWKGYRDACCLFVEMRVSKDKASSSSKLTELTKSDYCLCLAIHAPRKEIIEVWKMRTGPRDAFPGEPAVLSGKRRHRGLLLWALATAVSVALNLATFVRPHGSPPPPVDYHKARPLSANSTINLDHGDPTMFESFWRRMGDRGTIVIPGWQTMSYFSDPNNDCWFMEPEFAAEVRRLHRLVGNAVVDGRYIVVGTGSTQLFQAALYALSPVNGSTPMDVVSAVPYYSSYPAVTDFLKSGLFRWAGDANAYKGDSYIELVCSPNNPDGFTRTNVLSSETGKAIHDFAYYWPQYTPITSQADHDLMLFTVSKSTGHAGTRLGWALVKDRNVAKRMTKFIELNTIGVSKDSQVRAAKILKVISDGYELPGSGDMDRLFNYGRHLMAGRWEKLREAVRKAGIFSLPEFPFDTCNFTGERTGSYPAFAWLKCEKNGVEDCESFLRSHKILTRGGMHFGVEPTFVRVSMLDRDETFDLFTKRLSSIS